MEIGCGSSLSLNKKKRETAMIRTQELLMETTKMSDL